MLRRYLTDAELDRFVAVVRDTGDPRDHALFALLANTGMRPAEALALTTADVHVDATHAWLRIRRLKKRKAQPEYDDVELSQSLAAIVAEHIASLEPGARLFRQDRKALQHRFREYARRGRLSPHWRLYVLRHTAATRIYLATRDIKVVQTLLGHEKPDTSSLYAHVPPSLVMETIRRLAPVV